MKRLISIVVPMLMLISSAGAQNIRLGEHIPPIDVHSSMGTSLNLIDKEFVCLVFIHSDSLPCIEALDTFTKVTDKFADKVAVVLLTPEQQSAEQDIAALMTNDNVTLAFDKEYKTFEAFDIRYVPFGVIYDTKRRHTQWFGSIQQLDEQILTHITKSKKL